MTDRAALPGDRQLWLAGSVGVLLVAALLAVFPLRSDDVFLYLAIGRRFFEDGHLPTVDPFLYSIPDSHWNIRPEWASYLGAWSIFRVGGFDALILVKALWVVSLAALPLWVARRLEYRSPLVWVMAAWGCFAASARFVERTSLISDGLTAVVVAILVIEHHRPGRLRYLLPAIFVVWVNLHPGFPAGLAMLAFWLLADARNFRTRGFRTMAACVAASCLACLANPGFLTGALHPIRAAADPAVAILRHYYYEFMPALGPRFRGTSYVLAFVGLSAAQAGLLAHAMVRRRWPVFEALATAALVWQGVSIIRFVSLASLSLPILAISLLARSRWLELSPTRSRRSAAPLVAALAVALLAGASVRLAGWGYTLNGVPRHVALGLDEDTVPIRAADFLDDIDLRVPLFNQHDFGAYLAYRWDGRRALFYHGFVGDLYFFQAVYQAVSASEEDFDRIVRKYGIGAFLLARTFDTPDDGPLVVRILMRRPEWHLVYVDNVSVVFLRDVPLNRSAIERFSSRRVVPPAGAAGDQRPTAP